LVASAHINHTAAIDLKPGMICLGGFLGPLLPIDAIEK